MSGEERKPNSSFHNSLHIYFTKTTNFIDDHLRIIQNLVYGTAIIGGIIIIRSVKAFSKFKRLEDIPSDFVTKGIKLRGKVHSVHPVNIKKSPLERNEKLIKENISFSPHIGKLLQSHVPAKSQEKLTTSVYALVSHLSIFSFKKNESEDGFLIRLAGIQIYEEGLNQTEKDLVDKKIWFKILKKDENQTYLDCIVRSPITYFGSYNGHLVKKGLAAVEPFDQTLKDNKLYSQFYEKLIKEEAKTEKRKHRFWKKLKNFIFRSS